MAKRHFIATLFLLFLLTLVLVSCGRQLDPPIITTAATTTPSVTEGVTSAEITTTEAVVTTEDLFLNGTPGLIFESNNDGTAKVAGISDKTAKVITVPRTTPDGDRVIEIKFNAFAGNTAIETLRLPNTVYKISTGAFSLCSSLKSVFFSDGLEEIGSAAFQNCSSLESITLPKSFRTLGTQAFGGCVGLSYLSVSANNLTYKAEGNCLITKDTNTLVLGCRGSKIPKTVKAIEGFAFYEMGLSELLMPDSVVSVGNQAFAKNTAMKDVVLSESLKSLGDSAFSGCTSIESMYLPASLETLGVTPFRGCTAMKRLTVSESNTRYYAKDLCLVEKETARLVQGFVGSIVPQGVRVIGEYAFAFLPIYEIVIPDGVEKIERYALAYCDALQTVTLPKSLTEIAPDAFRNSLVLKIVNYGGNQQRFDILTANVALPDGVTVNCKES